MSMPIHFALNSTSYDEEGAFIPGGQGDRYLSSVWAALDEMGVPYTRGRQPKHGHVNAYICNRGRYSFMPRREISVHLSHGIASKGYRDNSQTHSFNFIVVPGPAFTEEIVASGGKEEARWVFFHGPHRQVMKGQRILELGYAKLDPLINGQVDGSGVFQNDGRVRVLYAPTHGGGSEAWIEGNREAPGARATSWWRRDEVMSLLDSALFDVVLAPHPRHSPGNQATFEQYVDADVVIADGGSTLYESLSQDKPIVVPAWITRERNVERAELYKGGTLEKALYESGIGYQVDSPNDLPRRVKEAAEGGVLDKDHAFMERVFPREFRGKSGYQWALFLHSLSVGTFGEKALRNTRRGARLGR